MLRIFGVNKSLQLVQNLKFKDLHKKDLAWYWIDFNKPNESEIKLLSTYFIFHV